MDRRPNRASDFANSKELPRIDRAKRVQYKAIFTTNITGQEEYDLVQGINALLQAEVRKNQHLSRTESETE